MSLLAVLLLAATAWCLVPPPTEPRLVALLGTRVASERRRLGGSAAAWVATSCAAVGTFALMPGVLGAGAAITMLAVIPVGVRRLETTGDRREREAMSRQAASVCDLLAATLASGAPLSTALDAVARAVPMPASGVLAAVHARLDLGADPHDAWDACAGDPSLAQIAAAVVRSARTGAPLATLLGRLADDLRRERRTVVEVAARSAGVRAVLPLAACFLPAFLLLGVVPVVASLATDLLGT